MREHFAYRYYVTCHGLKRLEAMLLRQAGGQDPECTQCDVPKILHLLAGYGFTNRGNSINKEVDNRHFKP
jgi:hypothetical protein